MGSAKRMAIEEIAACIKVGDMEGDEEEADYWSDLKASKHGIIMKQIQAMDMM